MMMIGKILFNIIIGILVFNYLKDAIIGYINARRFRNAIPKGLNEVYDKIDYEKSQDYKLENYKCSRILNLASFLVVVSFFIFDGIK